MRRDFTAQWGNTVSDDLVLSSGPPEAGGFYFGGAWTEQRNAGVVWLTGYRDLDAANAWRIRAVGVAGGHVLILWEQWTPPATSPPGG